MHNIKNLQFEVSEKGELSFSSDGFNPVLNANGDFWRMHLDDGENRELGVYSSHQKPSAIKTENNETTIYYDSITAEDGTCYNISFTIYIKNIDGALYFSADIENQADTRINELQFPLIDFEKISSDTVDEILYIPDGLGARYKNPREFIGRTSHTEYMAADYKNIWYMASYPHCIGANGAMSMPWLGIQSGSNFVYLSKQDEFFRVLNFCVGTGPRNTKSRLLLTISQYPALKKSEKTHIGDCVLSVFDGDWRSGSDYYKQWSQNTWYKEQPPIDWVKNMTGWQRIILKHQYGEIFFKYSDLPRVYENGIKYGINTLLIFGWWKGRFDNNYPEYEADPALGGEDELRKAIEKIHELGGRVILYTNGNLIDIKTDYYKDTGYIISSKDIDNNEYREHYRFANNGSILKTFGYKSFVTGCHATREWQNRLIENGKLKLSFNPDSIFYDQLCGFVKLCFDDSHLHKNRIDEEPHYRVENVVALKTLLSDKKALGTEWVADRFTTKFHYTHGYGNGTWYSESAYPDLYRHTFPECIISNRLIHDEREGYQEHLNYAFVTGLIFDVAINRCRAVDMSAAPAYAEYVKYLLRLKEKYHEFFYEGKFESACDLELPHNVWAAKYVNGTRFITALWNNTDSDVKINVYGKTTGIAKKSVLVAEGF